MKVSVQSVNFNISNDLVNFIEKKVNNLEKFHDHIIDAEVYLKVQSTSEKENKIVDIRINLPGVDVVAKKQSKTFEEGVSLAVDSVKRQLVKRKEKLRA
ncbi:ribosome hibernation-promoting factor, HPF/YfiA family [Lutimonas zeaxanthinifaciens]|uniref:ribosome hibernation-promoting factor, HPF/YfiA family n=1 Tax=Lutimonas zeaxanthinifaciens TaxID=3060215 RepID=UPI00265CBEA6|nr:ribosome-associated translation inhibitor RaiA [Lutimonas sp. YSD2104]WKK65299.1 ribosome-associated translation inhibitor RaiA [Lutimonas sp. YSD2104]